MRREFVGTGGADTDRRSRCKPRAQGEAASRQFNHLECGGSSGGKAAFIAATRARNSASVTRSSRQHCCHPRRTPPPPRRLFEAKSLTQHLDVALVRDARWSAQPVCVEVHGNAIEQSSKAAANRRGVAAGN